jgi:hypothetical protein
MPLLRIVHQPGVKQVFIASEAISDLATVEISTVGQGYVQVARANPERAAGVARGSAFSGQVVHTIVEGIVSGVTCAAAVNAGDRLMIASGGKVTPLNFGVVSGIMAASGIISGGFTLGKVIGKALMSSLAGSGLSMLVMGG